MNSANLIGRLTRDVVMKTTANGTQIAEFSLAVNDRRKSGDTWVDDPSFIDCTLFGRQAEALAQYLTRGKQIGVSGRLKQDRWQTAEGQKRSRVQIIVDRVDLLGQSDPRSESQPPAEHEPEDPGFSDRIPF